LTIFTATPDSIGKAAELLRQGELVAFPTETVYGLGADARNPEAVAKVFVAKGRPQDHPLIVHLGTASELPDWAAFVPEQAQLLAAAFWPGPLTMILSKKAEIPEAVTGGQNTIALRVPANQVAQDLLLRFGSGIAAPSANRYGRISPTQAGHVADEFGSNITCILDGGPCAIGVESTIIDLSGKQPALLRPGRISLSQLKSILQTEILQGKHSQTRAPGMLASHYAPNTTAKLCQSQALPKIVDVLLSEGKNIGLLTLTPALVTGDCRHNISLTENSAHYETELYSALRKLDKLNLDLILIEQPPDNETWSTVLDRLTKAAAGHD
jgi:L-threonylcarbamoyladenylate synthase